MTTRALQPASATPGVELSLEKIKYLIPHRYPFLLIDRLIDVVDGESATGIKNVTVNEPFFVGHFPNRPIMPGALLVEAMAQTAGALVSHSYKRPLMAYFGSIEKARFRKTVLPGDRLFLSVKMIQKRRNGQIWKFYGQALVEGRQKPAADAIFSAIIVDDDVSSKHP